MGKKDPRVDAYIEKAQPFAQPLLRHLRKVIHAACPEAAETIKWGHPHFDYKGAFAGVASFKTHASLGFWKAELLRNTVKGMPKTDASFGSFGRLTSLDDLPSEKTLAAIVKAAAKLNDDGVKVARTKKAPKPPVKVPPYFTAALKKNKRAFAAFDAFPPSHRREYVQWVTEARTEETRDKRLATAIEWISEGKGRNWKYERK